jgi:multidrug efflux pump subunit AcrA (membrane-fusion protein)
MGQTNAVETVTQYRFLPGQYVVMRLETGKREGLVIPTSAVIWREGKAQVWKAVGGGASDKSSQYTCTMHPEVISDRPGKCPKCGMPLVPKKLGGRQVAELVEVTTGVSNPDKTEIMTGLREGEEVIFAGYANLQPGMPVVATEWGSEGPKKLPLASEVAGNRLDASNNWQHQEMQGYLMIDV